MQTEKRRPRISWILTLLAIALVITACGEETPDPNKLVGEAVVKLSQMESCKLKPTITLNVDLLVKDADGRFTSEPSPQMAELGMDKPIVMELVQDMDLLVDAANVVQGLHSTGSLHLAVAGEEDTSPVETYLEKGPNGYTYYQKDASLNQWTRQEADSYDDLDDSTILLTPLDLKEMGLDEGEWKLEKADSQVEGVDTWQLTTTMTREMVEKGMSEEDLKAKKNLEEKGLLGENGKLEIPDFDFTVEIGKEDHQLYRISCRPVEGQKLAIEQGDLRADFSKFSFEEIVTQHNKITADKVQVPATIKDQAVSAADLWDDFMNSFGNMPAGAPEGSGQ